MGFDPECCSYTVNHIMSLPCSQPANGPLLAEDQGKRKQWAMPIPFTLSSLTAVLPAASATRASWFAPRTLQAQMSTSAFCPDAQLHQAMFNSYMFMDTILTPVLLKHSSFLSLFLVLTSCPPATGWDGLTQNVHLPSSQCRGTHHLL